MHGRTVWSMQRCVWWDAVGDLQVQNGTARICREVRARRRAQKIAAGCLSPRTLVRDVVRLYASAWRLVQNEQTSVFLAWFLDVFLSRAGAPRDLSKSFLSTGSSVTGGGAVYYHQTNWAIRPWSSNVTRQFKCTARQLAVELRNSSAVKHISFAAQQS